MFVDGPLQIQVEFAGIKVQAVAGTHRIEIKVEGSDCEVFQGVGFQANMMNASVAVERAGIVGSNFPLEPGSVTTGQAAE
ncbi:hypothetical protein D3C76_1647810 [compost metagenome]